MAINIVGMRIDRDDVLKSINKRQESFLVVCLHHVPTMQGEMQSLSVYPSLPQGMCRWTQKGMNCGFQLNNDIKNGKLSMCWELKD